MTTKTPRRTGALSPEMALLGFLHGAPGHGYDLHRKVITNLGQVWHLSQSQAYAILKRLEMRGDIVAEDIPQEKLPHRQRLHITPQGRKRFLDWLGDSSGGSVRAIRMELITRLYFLSQYQPEKISRAIDQQKVAACSHLQRLEKTYAELPGEQTFNRMSLGMRLKQLQAILEWLDECQKNFQ